MFGIKDHNAQVRLGTMTVIARIGNYLAAGRHTWTTERHSNSDFELHIIRRGACQFDIGEESLYLSAMDAMLISPGVFHRPQIQGEEIEHLSLPLSIRPDPDTDLPAFLRAPYSRFQIDFFEDQLCGMLFDEILRPRPFYSEVTSALFSLLLSGIIRRLLKADTVLPAAEFPPVDFRAHYIDGFFERYLAEYGTEDILAEKLHLSRRQLSRVLHDTYGTTFRQKLILARMDRAAYLLRTTTHPINSIISMVGYTSETAFFRAFQQHYHTTPRKYRQAYLAQSSATI